MKMQFPYRWRIKTIVPNIQQIFDEIKYFWQRGRRGYSDRDVWSIDYYLCKVLPPMLKQLKETTHGYPGQGEANTPEKWGNILDEMVAGFEAAKRVLDDEYLDIVQPNWFDKDSDLGYSADSITRESIEKVNILCFEDKKLFEKKMKVFTKYFFSLWD